MPAVGCRTSRRRRRRRRHHPVARAARVLDRHAAMARAGDQKGHTPRRLERREAVSYGTLNRPRSWQATSTGTSPHTASNRRVGKGSVPTGKPGNVAAGPQQPHSATPAVARAHAGLPTTDQHSSSSAPGRRPAPRDPRSRREGGPRRPRSGRALLHDPLPQRARVGANTDGGRGRGTRASPSLPQTPSPSRRRLSPSRASPETSPGAPLRQGTAAGTARRPVQAACALAPAAVRAAMPRRRDRGGHVGQQRAHVLHQRVQGEVAGRVDSQQAPPAVAARAPAGARGLRKDLVGVLDPHQMAVLRLDGARRPGAGHPLRADQLTLSAPAARQVQPAQGQGRRPR